MATVRLCCHGNIPSCLTLHLLSSFPEIQPLSPVGCEHLEGFRLSPSDVCSTWFKSNNLSLCSREKTFSFVLMLLQHTFLLDTPPPPLCPSFSVSLCEYDSVSPPLFFPHSPPQNSPQSASPSHNRLFVASLHQPLTFAAFSRRGVGGCGSHFTTRTRRRLGAQSSTGTR